MGEHAAPYSQPIEGFTNPAISTAINNIKNASSDNSALTQKQFLIDLLQTEKDTADTLMKAAGRFTSLSNKKELSDNAFDASFETDPPSQITGPSATLQGFSYLLFFASYIALAIVLSVKIYVSTQNIMNSIFAFLGFLLIGVFLIAIIRQTA
uniref:Uncharacterized protein n=1 Tax=viral metagenome TaxID=1070528 RepID=A0A6C0K924_9ZZZZ